MLIDDDEFSNSIANVCFYRGFLFAPDDFEMVTKKNSFPYTNPRSLPNTRSPFPNLLSVSFFISSFSKDLKAYIQSIYDAVVRQYIA